MRALGMLVVFLFTLAFAIVGGLLLAFALDLVTTHNLTDFLCQAFQIQSVHLIIGGIGIFLIIASISIAQITFGKMQREKTIAFNNPDGQVTVSLAAIEDFIRKLSSSISEIKDLRSNVIAGKKGIEISVRVSLWADANIPEVTEHIQTTIKNRIQQMLGIEEPIVVKVHVGKIVSQENKQEKKKQQREEAIKPSQFRGSIEYGKE